MIYEIYLGMGCSEADLGDVFFWILSPEGVVARYQHVALCYQEGPFAIRTSQDPVTVLEFEELSQRAQWPNNKYCVQVVGQMVIRGKPLSWEERARIIRVAEKLVWPQRFLLNLVETRSCEWAKEPYKYIAPDPDRPESATKIRLTCATFVEYCYEQAGFDIVNDGRGGENLPKVSWGGKLLPRLFPGYLIKAFQLDKYPLDLTDLEKKGEDPAKFQRWGANQP